MRLRDKRTVITGAGSGLGRATALRFAQEGARVAVVDIDGDKARETAALIGESAISVQADVTDKGAVVDAVSAAVEAFGGVDVFFNNAGIPQRVTPLTEVTSADWNNILAVNLTAIFFGAQAVTPIMRRQGGGSILITSSISGRRPRPGLSAYTASKGGAIAFTAALAVELAPNIRVNGIAPLAALTPMLDQFQFGDNPEEVRGQLMAAVPLRRLVDPEDIAGAAVYLSSDEARCITGVTLNVDCGRNL